MHRERVRRVRRLAWRLAGPAAAALLTLRPGAASSAAFLPGRAQADPPTGQVERGDPALGEPAAAGIQWGLAVPRYEGSASINGRWLRYGDGTSSALQVAAAQVDFASYVWQPWFIQVRGGAGALVAYDTSDASVDSGNGSSSSTGTGLVGRLGVVVFPSSRFPFEARYELSDSRTSTDNLGTDYRAQRITLNQAYSPEAGNASLFANLELSRLAFNDGASDTLSNLRLSANQRVAAHAFELGAQYVDNARSDPQSRSSFSIVDGRYTYNPDGSLNVDTLASWNRNRLQAGPGAGDFDASTDVRQLSSFATWRTVEGEWLGLPDTQAYATGSARLLDAGADFDGQAQRTRLFNAAIGGNVEWRRDWRAAGVLSATQSQIEDLSALRSASAALSLNYSPQGISLGSWLYSPTVGVSGGVLHTNGGEGTRLLAGGQVTNSFSRDFGFGDAGSLALNFSQSLGAARDSVRDEWARAIANSLSVNWQSGNDPAGQSYAGLSLSDSRVLARESGNFQMVNLQLNRRATLSRDASWSGSLTLQATRSEIDLFDALSGRRVQGSTGWQAYYSGAISYDNQRLFGVPRLRLNVLVAVNSLVLESRAEGDVDAPPDPISESAEARLDYQIGRLDARLGARLARIEGRTVTQAYFRVVRYF